MRLRPLVAPSSLVLVLALAATARAAEPPAAPQPYGKQAPAAPPAARPPATSAEDDVLRRLLRSGCHDGLAEARALAASGTTTATWAPTVSRLCVDILTDERQAANVPLAIPRERDGRAAIVIGSSIYGIWLGIATDVLFEMDSPRGAIVPPLVGMGAGLGLSLLATSDRPITAGQAWTINTGYDYGSINGALWAGGLDLSAKGVVGTALATGLSASAIGVLVAHNASPRQGDIEVVRSGLLWGTVTGMLGMVIVSPDISSETFFRGSGVAMDLGFLAGLALAASFDVSRNRDLIIDAGGLGGGFVGFGITWLATAGPNASGRAIAGGTLGGVYAGLALMAYLTRDMDHDEDEDAPHVAALFGRDARGRWGWGTPTATPVMDGLGHRVVGATFSALGGTF